MQEECSMPTNFSHAMLACLPHTAVCMVRPMDCLRIQREGKQEVPGMAPGDERFRANTNDMLTGCALRLLLKKKITIITRSFTSQKLAQ